MTSTKKKPKEPIPYERPLLMELISDCAKIVDGPMAIEKWHEVFYNLSMQDNAPKCLLELQWEMKDGYMQSRDLNDLLSFRMALQKIPGNIG